MFTETNKYKTNGHFFYMPGSSWATISKEVPHLPGIYYILRLAGGKIDLVFIGKAGISASPGSLKTVFEGGTEKGHHFIDSKMNRERIDGLDIYWFVTMDEENSDTPEFAEALLKKRYQKLYGRLPEWNEKA